MYKSPKLFFLKKWKIIFNSLTPCCQEWHKYSTPQIKTLKITRSALVRGLTQNGVVLEATRGRPRARAILLLYETIALEVH